MDKFGRRLSTVFKKITGQQARERAEERERAHRAEMKKRSLEKNNLVVSFGHPL